MQPQTKTLWLTISAMLVSLAAALTLWVNSFDVPPPPTPPPSTGKVQVGKSGMRPSDGITAAGNIHPSFGGWTPFANGFYWQWFAHDCRTEPVDENSDYILQEQWGPFGAKLHIDFSSTGVGYVSRPYGYPFNVVPHDQPLLAFDPPYYPSDAGPLRMPPLGSYENEVEPLAGPPGMMVGDYDRHISFYVLDSVTGVPHELCEVYQVRTNDGGTNWQSSSIARWNLVTGEMRQEAGKFGADAAALPIAPLLLKYDDVASGDVGHVIRATFPVGIIYGRYVFPARSSVAAAGDTRLLRFGVRLRLQQVWYEAHKGEYTGQARVILDGMYKYGLINTDITGTGLGSGPYIGGVPDDRWDQNNLLTLQNIPVTAFEVIKQYPAFTVTGPTTIAAGETAVFTVTKYPPGETNFGGGVYAYANGVYFASGGLIDATNPLKLSFDTPATPGVFTISFQHGDQSWTVPPDLVLTTN